MKKIITFALLAPLLLASGGCAQRSAMQKKTSWYKHHKSGKHVPCPCEGH